MGVQVFSLLSLSPNTLSSYFITHHTHNTHSHPPITIVFRLKYNSASNTDDHAPVLSAKPAKRQKTAQFISAMDGKDKEHATKVFESEFQDHFYNIFKPKTLILISFGP